MESIEKLRELAADINSAEIIDHLDVAGKFVFHSEWLDSWHKAFDAACDEIESEIAERYMELPKDADGVPIKPFDEIEQGRVAVVTNDSGGQYVFIYRGFDRGCYLFEAVNAGTCHHVKPRTIEDVLAEFFNESRNSYTSEMFDLVGKYSDEIRGLL